MKPVSIQVTAWRKPELTKDCVDSIRHSMTKLHSDIPYELLIIDDHSEDAATYAYYDQLKAEGIKVLIKPLNCGLPDSRNLGIHFTTKDLSRPDMSSQYSYVAQVSNDCKVCGNWLRNLIDVLESNCNYTKKVVTASPVWRNYGPAPFQRNYQEQVKLNTWQHNCSFDKLDEYAIQYENDWGHWISGEDQQSFFGGLVVFEPRSFLEYIGWFDCRYFAFYEDNDIMQKANMKHVCCVSIGKAWIHHLGGATISMPNIIGSHDGKEWNIKEARKIEFEKRTGGTCQW